MKIDMLKAVRNNVKARKLIINLDETVISTKFKLTVNASKVLRAEAVSIQDGSADLD